MAPLAAAGPAAAAAGPGTAPGAGLPPAGAGPVVPGFPDGLTRPVAAPGCQPIAGGLLPLSLPAAAGPLPGADRLPGPPPHDVTGIVGIDEGAAAGPSPRDVLSRLAADPRMTWWAWRALMAVVVGVAVTLPTSWRLGLTAAAAVAIADTVFRSRTSSVIPAPARVTSAQRKTRRRLARLSPSGYLALHSRLIPGSGSAIDHLVIGPAGVFAVDSERWDRRLPVRATHGGQLFHGPYPQADRLRAARWEADQASQLIGAALGEPVAVRPAMVIYGPPVPWVVVRIAGVDVFCGRRLRKYLRRETAASRAHRLDDRQIELICGAAARVLPPAR